ARRVIADAARTGAIFTGDPQIAEIAEDDLAGVIVRVPGKFDWCGHGDRDNDKVEQPGEQEAASHWYLTWEVRRRRYYYQTGRRSCPRRTRSRCIRDRSRSISTAWRCRLRAAWFPRAAHRSACRRRGTSCRSSLRR